MSDSPIALETDWVDALHEAARALPPGDPEGNVFLEDREDLRVVLGSEGVEDAVATRSLGIAVRSRGSLVFRSDPDPEDAARLVRRQGVGRAPRRASERGPWLESARALETARVLLAAAAQAAPGLEVSVRWVGFRQLVGIATSGGKLRTDVRGSSRVRIEVHGKSFVAVGERVLLADGTDRDALDECARGVALRALERRETRPAPTGRVPVVFAAGIGGILVHEIVGHALEADAVRDGSLLADREVAVAPRTVTVIDDPRRGRASWRVDDEGSEATATALVREGRVSGVLTDASTARAGEASTGHGRTASYAQPVRPRMGCTFLAPGALDPGEVLEGTARGVFVRRMEGAGTEPAKGVAFFRVTDADRIVDGKLDAPLDAFLLEVSTLEGLASLDRIASDLTFDPCIGSCVRDGQPLATSVGAPTCRLGLATVFL